VQVNPDIYLNKGVVQKAAGDHFDKVWDILKQSLSLRRDINFIFQGVFFVLLVISGAYFKWHYNMMHVLLFAAGMVLIPFCNPDERYIMPFMPLYFILWLFILNAGYGVMQTEIKDKVFLRNAVLAVFVCIVSIYFAAGCKQIYQRCRYFSYDVEQNKIWLQAASRIKEDSVKLPRRAKIMASNNYLSYLTDSDYIRLPYYIFDWTRVINFALLKKVNYMVISGDYIDSYLAFSRGDPRKRWSNLNINGNNDTLWVLKIGTYGE
jgi:hypothetical protein